MPNEKLTFGGIPVTVVSDNEAEKSDYLICLRADQPSYFDDDLFGFCVECSARVRYRWHAPRKPKRLCTDCFQKLENRTHAISKTTREESS